MTTLVGVTADDATVYQLACYGQPTGTPYPSYRIARRAAEHHIRSCPQGPMPWARQIRWHHLDRQPWMEPGEVEMWASAAYGEWLNHQIVHVAQVDAALPASASSALTAAGPERAASR